MKIEPSIRVTTPWKVIVPTFFASAAAIYLSHSWVMGLVTLVVVPLGWLSLDIVLGRILYAEVLGYLQQHSTDVRKEWFKESEMVGIGHVWVNNSNMHSGIYARKDGIGIHGTALCSCRIDRDDILPESCTFDRASGQFAFSLRATPGTTLAVPSSIDLASYLELEE